MAVGRQGRFGLLRTSNDMLVGFMGVTSANRMESATTCTVMVLFLRPSQESVGCAKEGRRGGR